MPQGYVDRRDLAGDTLRATVGTTHKLIRSISISLIAVFVGLALAPVVNAEVIKVPPGNRNGKRPNTPGLSKLWTTFISRRPYEAKYRRVYGMLKRDKMLISKIKKFRQSTASILFTWSARSSVNTHSTSMATTACNVTTSRPRSMSIWICRSPIREKQPINSSNARSSNPAPNTNQAMRRGIAGR